MSENIVWTAEIEAQLGDLVLEEMFDFDAVADKLWDAVHSVPENAGLNRSALSATVVKKQYALVTKKQKSELTQLKAVSSPNAVATTRAGTSTPRAGSGGGLLDALSPLNAQAEESGNDKDAGVTTPNTGTQKKKAASSKKKKRQPFVLSDDLPGPNPLAQPPASPTTAPAASTVTKKANATDTSEAAPASNDTNSPSGKKKRNRKKKKKGQVQTTEQQQPASNPEPHVSKSSKTPSKPDAKKKRELLQAEDLHIDFGSVEDAVPVELVGADDDPTLGFDLSHVAPVHVKPGSKTQTTTVAAPAASSTAKPSKGEGKGKTAMKTEKTKGKKQSGKDKPAETKPVMSPGDIGPASSQKEKPVKGKARAKKTPVRDIESEQQGDDFHVDSRDPKPSGYSIFQGPDLKSRIASIYTDVRSRLPTINTEDNDDDSESDLELDEEGVPRIVMSKNWDADPGEDPFEAMDRLVRGGEMVYDSQVIGVKTEESHTTTITSTPSRNVDVGGEESESLSASEWSPTGSSDSRDRVVQESSYVQTVVTESFKSSLPPLSSPSQEDNTVSEPTPVANAVHSAVNSPAVTSKPKPVDKEWTIERDLTNPNDAIAVAAAKAVAAAAAEGSMDGFDAEALAQLERDFLAAVRTGLGDGDSSAAPTQHAMVPGRSSARGDGPVLRVSEQLEDIDLDRLLAAVEAGTVHGTLDVNGEAIDDPLGLDDTSPDHALPYTSTTRTEPVRPQTAPMTTMSSPTRKTVTPVTTSPKTKTEPQRRPMTAAMYGRGGARGGGRGGGRGGMSGRSFISRADVHDDESSSEEEIDWRAERRRMKEQLASTGRQ